MKKAPLEVPSLFSAFHGVRVRALFSAYACSSFCCGALPPGSHDKPHVVCLPAAAHSLRIHIVTCNYGAASMDVVNLSPLFDRDVDHIRGVLKVSVLF